jgi:hypothetical protein
VELKTRNRTGQDTKRKQAEYRGGHWNTNSWEEVILEDRGKDGITNYIKRQGQIVKPNGSDDEKGS